MNLTPAGSVPMREIAEKCASRVARRQSARSEGAILF